MPCYFVRVNGDTSHNNPNDVTCYVQGEPPRFPATYFNYYQYCIDNNIVRIGWPDVGDVLAANKIGALANCYDWNNIDNYVRNYLTSFSQIPLTSIVLMPNKDNPGELCCGEVIKTYWYHHNVPTDPYECSHRIGIKWDCDKNGRSIKYWANQFGIDIHGGWWRYAFYEIQDINTINRIINR